MLLQSVRILANFPAAIARLWTAMIAVIRYDGIMCISGGQGDLSWGGSAWNPM
jgi:hypothetical protein